MKLGISGQVLSEVRSLEEILKILKIRNVEAIELWAENIPAMESKSVMWGSFRGRDISSAKELIKRYGIKVACVTMGGAFISEFALDRILYAEELKYAVEVAAELGAGTVNHYCYYLSLDEKPDTRLILPAMELALKKAEELGITLALENEAHDATRTPEGMLDIVRAAGSPNFKTNFDATNYYHAGCEGFPHAYEVLKDHIAYVHIKNGCIYRQSDGHDEKSKGSRMTGLLEGESIYYPTARDGAVNIDGLLCRLAKDGYRGYCTLEPHTHPNLAERYYDEEIAYLRSSEFFI